MFAFLGYISAVIHDVYILYTIIYGRTAHYYRRVHCCIDYFIVYLPLVLLRYKNGYSFHFYNKSLSNVFETIIGTITRNVLISIRIYRRKHQKIIRSNNDKQNMCFNSRSKFSESIVINNCIGRTNFDQKQKKVKDLY